jgi:hypothetical protein
MVKGESLYENQRPIPPIISRVDPATPNPFSKEAERLQNKRPNAIIPKQITV